MQIKIKKALLEGYQPEVIVEGFIMDTISKYKKPIIAGATAGFIGVTSPAVYQSTISPEAKIHEQKIENAVRNTSVMEPYKHLAKDQLTKQLDEKFKNDKIGATKFAGELLADKGVNSALSDKNQYQSNIDNKYIKHDLPVGILGGALGGGLLSAGIGAIRRKR